MRDALPEARGRSLLNLKVVGVGNPWRRDDAAGLVAAQRLRGSLPPDVEVSEETGEPTALIDAWAAADAVWVVDAVRSDGEAGTVHRFEPSDAPLPTELFGASTHHFGLAEAIELARALGRLPARVVIYGIEGFSFEAGAGLTPEVDGAVDRVVERVRDEVAQVT